MPVQVLGVGWEFPVALKDERIRVARYEACVRQSIFLILSTAKGERVMRPDFGCGLHDLVFSVNGPSTQGMAEFHVREALEKWEPRIDVMRVQASGAGGYGEQLLIEIDYRVRLTDNRFNLVYPFYLDRPLT
ncbi:GPW/gp25 family protein [Paraburkholderia ribeironis]|uniref:GPW/gp25 family protein n=1 Tax=Paraburkholderia ribeironis TaxID=1247936 RepID=A0A1N7S7K8_9BURK|nr:GPW/gp25 family protein [Paraburkholderia ribeironis]SIT43312.1 GPW/gp25 family protein [Paraburkholderia ribeironis]